MMKDDSEVRAWKGHDWEVLDRLHAAGYISDPKNKAKSLSRLCSPKKERAGRKSCSLSTSAATAEGKNCGPGYEALPFRVAADLGKLQIPPLRFAPVGMTLL
jgi:hypothetical protein